MTNETTFGLTADEARAAMDALWPKDKQFKAHEKKTPAEKLALGSQVLDMTLQGRTLRDIASHFGFAPATAMHYRDLAMSTYVVPIAETAVKEQIALVDQIIAINMARVINGEDNDGKAAGIVLRALERKTKLLGLDKPVQVEQSVQVNVETPEEREQRLFLEQWTRDAAVAQHEDSAHDTANTQS